MFTVTYSSDVYSLNIEYETFMKIGSLHLNSSMVRVRQVVRHKGWAMHLVLWCSVVVSCLSPAFSFSRQITSLRRKES